MSKANSLGGGLQLETIAMRRVMAADSLRLQRHKEAAAPPPPAAAPPTPAAKRKFLAFKPKLPGVTPKAKAAASTAPKTRTRLVVKVKVKRRQKA